MSTGPDVGATSSGWSEASRARSPGEDPLGVHQQSIGSLVAEVSRDLSTLMRQEVELAKAEATTAAKRAGRSAGLLSSAGIAGHMVLVFLSVAAWWGLGSLLGRGWSALVVAAAWAIVAAVLALLGRREMRAIRGMPETVDTVKKIPDALQGREGEPR